ncbi:hypothetical protein [Actinomadura coerulea]|uniref:hypothetical protein n=1 Tax=Actinomadura coerulea TaxID=46159 RepID=UPI00343CEB69
MRGPGRLGRRPLREGHHDRAHARGGRPSGADVERAEARPLIPGIRRVNLWSTLNPTKNRWEILTCGQFSDLLD